MSGKISLNSSTGKICLSSAGLVQLCCATPDCIRGDFNSLDIVFDFTGLSSNDYVQWGAPPNVVGPATFNWTETNFTLGPLGSSGTGGGPPYTAIPSTVYNYDFGNGNDSYAECWGMSNVNVTCPADDEISIIWRWVRLESGFYVQGDPLPAFPWGADGTTGLGPSQDIGTATIPFLGIGVAHTVTDSNSTGISASTWPTPWSFTFTLT